MTAPKCAVFSTPGLGDGIIALTISNNLHRNGWDVITYHEQQLSELQDWFLHLKIEKFPPLEKIDEVLHSFDRIFVFYSDSSIFIKSLIDIGKKKDPTQIIVINPCFSRNVGNQFYYEDSFFDPNLCMVDNIKNFCAEVLHLPNTTKSNGIIAPQGLVHRKYENRIVIHPTSSKDGKNWPAKKYVKLALHLKKLGFNPKFIVGPHERGDWEWLEKKDIEVPRFDRLDLLAKYIYQSGYFIGNDSGVGHLASCQNIPTLSIFRNKRFSKLWRPGWAVGKVIFPHPLIPNVFFYRLRDRQWKKFVPLKKVLKAFFQLNEEVKKGAL